MNLQPPTARDRPVVLQQWLREATRLHTLGALQEAEQFYKAILKAQPNHLDAQHLLGLLRQQEGRLDEALKLIRQVIKAAPNLPTAHVNLGNVLRSLGRHQDALASFTTALRLKPDYIEALNNCGVLLLLDLKRPQDALDCFDRALLAKPDYGDALYNRGLALATLDRQGEAITALERAISVIPGNTDARTNLGRLYLTQKRYADALVQFEAVIASKPADAEAHKNRAATLRELKRPQEALAGFATALALKPDFVIALIDQGLAYRDLARFEDELASYERALQLSPDTVDALHNRGVALYQLGRSADALASFDRALALSGDRPHARFDRSLVLLLRGDLAEGFAEYRHRTEPKSPHILDLVARTPAWTGEPLAGRHIVIHAEQGLGDTIQFVRYLPMVAATGAEVTFLVKPSLHRLLQPLATVAGIAERQDPNRPADVQCALMDLPAAFATRLDTIPASIPYLAAEPALIARWRERIGTAGFRIGIVWQGNPTAQLDPGRSIPLAEFAPLSQVANARLISLQKSHGLDQLDQLPPGMHVETPGPDVDAGPDAFIDTAAIMMSLDLIVTSDTAIAHLAGSLGRPVWLALRHVPDWRWMIDRQDSPWYPTMRLYRQSVRGQWHDVFARIASDLRHL